MPEKRLMGARLLFFSGVKPETLVFALGLECTHEFSRHRRNACAPKKIQGCSTRRDWHGGFLPEGAWRETNARNGEACRWGISPWVDRVLRRQHDPADARACSQSFHL